jgi:hypothetical protein
VSPGFSGVRRSVNSITHRKVRPLQTLTTGGVNNVRVRWSHGNSANRLGGLIFKYRIPGAAIVVRFPNTAVALAHVENIRLARHAGRSAGPSSPERTNHPPLHFLVGADGILLCVTNTRAQSKNQKSKDHQAKPENSNQATPLSQCIAYLKSSAGGQFRK